MNRTKILKFYRGQARDRASAALDVLARAIEAGEWPKGASRSVKAALRKTGKREVAFAVSTAEVMKLRHADHIAIRHGTFERATAQALEEAATHRPIISGTDAVLEWIEAFRPVAEAVAALDAARPKPVYVFEQISAAVHANVAAAMGLRFTTAEQPPVEWHQVEIEKLDFMRRSIRVKVWVPEIKWPEGTRHSASKFAMGSAAGNSQCEACGHAIKNAHNWVPLLLRSTDGAPYSLWVGKNCAKNIFGCKVDGDLWAGTEAPK